MCSTVGYAPTVANRVNICNDQVRPVAISAGLGAVVSGCVAGVLGVVNPLGGVVFGATAAAANLIAATLISTWADRDWLHRDRLTLCLMIPFSVVNAVAAAAVTALAGFPMTWVGVAVCASAVFAAQTFVTSGLFRDLHITC